MKAVLISIKPKWCELIANGKKMVEVRKDKPKLDVPFKCYIYMTAGYASYPVTINGEPYTCHNNGGMVVIGEFVCDKIYNLVNAFGGIVFADESLNQLDPQLFRDMSCLTDEKLSDYLVDKDGYAWHISDLVIYDNPKCLREFIKHGFDKPIPLRRPPQSWMYVEVEG